jgi:GNAT superfamily N-acetyltransferase
MALVTAAGRDTREIVALIREQFVEHEIEIDEQRLIAAVAAVLADESLGAFLLARAGERCVGVAYLSFVWALEHGGRSAWLEELYVIPDERNRGVGAQLVQAALAYAREHGCAALDLEVEDSQRRAENLYRRHGFVPRTRARWVRELV